MHDFAGAASIVEGVHAGLDDLLEADLSTVDDGALLGALVDTYRAESRTTAAKARLIAEVESRNAHALVGARTTAQWIAGACRIPRGVARHDTLLARSLRSLPETAARLADGDVGTAQASRIAFHQRNPRTREALEGDEAMLAGEAARLPWSLFAKVIAYWAQLADPEGTDDDAEDRCARRRAHLSRTFEGNWVLDGQFDPVSGAVLHSALRQIEDEMYAADRAEAKERLGRDPLPHELRRTPAQRRADAVVEMANRAMSTPEGSRRPAPLVTILVGYETFAGRVCELADGTVIAPSDVASVLDKAMIERIVFDGPSRVIDVGEQRLFTGGIRRAIEVRDRTCMHPFCDEPVERCHVDHKIPYAAGGPTEQWNGRLYCAFHNHLRQQRRGPPGIDW